MKLVRLKEDFINQAVKIDPEFEQKHWRGYALVITDKRSRYLIPLRSRCNHPYCFKNEVLGKFLDFSKSFELVNDSIVDSAYFLEKREFTFYNKNINTIRVQLKQFNRMRKKFKFAVNIEKIKKIQRNY